jgi:hypothetical protein
LCKVEGEEEDGVLFSSPTLSYLSTILSSWNVFWVAALLMRMMERYQIGDEDEDGFFLLGCVLRGSEDWSGAGKKSTLLQCREKVGKRKEFRTSHGKERKLAGMTLRQKKIFTASHHHGQLS